MSTINPQIDAAIPQMKARAAEFDDSFTTPYPGMSIGDLLGRAHDNVSAAMYLRHVSGHGMRDDILDTMNICALALSVLPPAKP